MIVNWLLTKLNYYCKKLLIIDSSDVGTGSVLVQEASDGLDHPVSYFSKKFLKYQKNYSVVEKETLGLVLAFLMFI